MLSSRDLRVVLREMDHLANASLENFYGGFKELYAFKFRRPGYGTDYVLVDLSLPTFHSSTIRPKFPQMPPGKIMNFRKHIKGQRVEYAYPEENERIVHILLSNGIEIVVELFGGGNIILLREDKSILMALKYREFSARSIKPGEPYRLPPQPEPLSPDFTIQRGLVSDLVRRYGVPPKYAREIAFRAGLPEDAKELDEDEKKLVYEIYVEILDEIENSEGGYVYESAVSPIELKHLGEPVKVFESFNEALDHVYAKHYEELLRYEVTKRYEEAKKKVLKVIKSQESGLKRLEEKLERLQAAYEALSMHIAEVEELLETIRKARKRLSWEEIEEKLLEAKAMGIPAAKIFDSLRPKEGKIVLDLGLKVSLDLRKSAFENLNKIAEEIKKTRSKIERVRSVLEEKRKELDRIDELIEQESRIEVERRERKKRKRRYRYERFRRIKLENALIVGGKDRRTNEELIRRRMEPEDLVFHADYYGAPFVLLKGEKSEESIREAALMAGAFSRARKDGLNYVSVFYVHADQVMLGAPSGQYVPKGAFVIRGRRNYLDVVLRWAIGEGVRGSPERVKKLSKRYIVLAPGGDQKEFNRARKIAMELTGYDRLVPSGSRIIEERL